MNKKVYISGAIAHYDIDERKRAFAVAEVQLRRLGMEPVNPFRNGLPEDADWREHMRIDIANPAVLRLYLHAERLGTQQGSQAGT